MSDYFLNKIYDSLLNKKPVPKKPESIVEKKESFKPLSKVYEILIREKVEHVAIYGSKDDVDPYNIPQHPELDSLGVVPKNVVDNIKKEIKKETKFKTEEGEEVTVTQVLDRLLKNKGWKEGNGEYETVLNRTVQAFTQKEIVFQNFINFIKYSKLTTNLFRQKLLQAPQTFVNISQLIPDWFNSFFEDKDGLTVINSVMKISFKAGVDVGKGELALSMLCDARKGDVGDLYFDADGIDVELKGRDGRFGGDGFTNNHTVNELTRILNRGEDELFNQTSNRLKRDIFKTIDGIIARRESVKGTENEIRYYNKIKQDIAAAKSFDEIISDLEKFLQGGSIIKEFAKRISQIVNSLKNYVKHVKKEVKGSFSPAVTSFFANYKELSDQQLIDGILATRNYSASNLLNELKEGITDIVNKEKDTLFSEGGVNQNLKCLIAALHGICYHDFKNIANILFFNKNYDFVLYNFPGQTVKEKIISMYNFFKNNKVTISLSVDPSIAKSVSIDF